jgi:hypothetical protein
VHVFVSNSITGTISRLDLAFNGGVFSLQGAFTIASGYTHRADPATFEVSPTGLAFDATRDILYVASTGDNTVFAVRNAGKLNQSLGTGQGLFSGGHLHGALAMALAPNGHLLISNSDEFNPNPQEPSAIDEYTVNGQFIGQIFVDPNPGGAFGLNIANVLFCLAQADQCLRFFFAPWRLCVSFFFRHQSSRKCKTLTRSST